MLDSTLFNQFYTFMLKFSILLIKKDNFVSLEIKNIVCLMNQEFDCNELFAQFNASCQYSAQFDQKPSNDSNYAIITSSPYTGDNMQQSIHNYFSLEVCQPKQINHTWIDNQQQLMEKAISPNRKDTADFDQIAQHQIATGRPTRKKRGSNDAQKNQTKNIPKNFGKAIVAFIQNNKKLAKNVLEKYNSGSYKDFIEYLNNHKKQITTIADLRSLWLENHYEQVLRTLSSLFLRKYSLQYIFNSRICNYGSHIKYRQRFLEAIKSPQEFQHIKQY